MADILLTVGVEPSLSFTEFEKGINALVSKLNAHPPKIKVVLDDASIKSMKAQILSLKQEVKMSTRTDGYAMDKSGIWVKNTSAIKENTKAKKENVAASKQTANVQNGYAKTDSGIWLKSTTAINENTKAKQKNASANKLVDHQGDYSKTEAGIWVKNTSSIAENTTAKEKNAQISKQIIATSDGYSKTASGIWVKETEQINANTVAKQKNAQASKASATGVSSGAYTQTASGIWIKEAAAIDKSTIAKVKNTTAQKKVQKETEILTAGSQKQQTAIQQVNSLYAQTTKNMRNWTAAQKSSYGVPGHYNNLGEQAQQLKTLKERLEEGKISVEDYRKSYNGIKESVSTSNEAIKEAGANTKSLGDRVGSLSSKFASWLTISQVIMAAVRTMKEMVSASIEVENAMTQIKIVTGASETEMKNFLTTSISLAKELGQSVTDVASSIETFARLGYNIDQSTQLAKYANIMSNVGNTDVGSATTGITSIIKGYELNPSDAKHVSDVLVKVGQEYAISAEELMEAFARGGAALHASGTDFEKSAALFAATNASLQNAETTGTMWKTVSARIRGATTELEEMGEETDGLAQGLSKYEAEIKALSGVDIMKDKNTYKDMYEIFVELAQAWDKMPDVSQSRVAEILGGTRNTSGIMSTITNIKDAIGAYSSALDSAGTAEKANAEYMDTTKAKIGELKAAFQELSSTFVKSDFLKIGVDGLKGFIEMIDKLISSIGSLNTILLGVGITKGIKNIFEAKKAGTANGMSGTLAAAFPQISEGISAASAKFKELSKAGSGTFAALKGGASAFLSSINPLTAGIAAIGIAITAYSAYQQHIKEQAQAATQASEAWQKSQNSLSDFKNKIVDLKTQLASGSLSETEAYNAKSQLLSIQQELTDSYGSQASAINLVNGELSAQTELIDALSQKEAQKYLNKNASGITKAEKEMTTKRDYSLGTYDPTSKKGKKITSAINDMQKKYGKDFYTTQESGHGFTVHINADVTQADEAINEFMNRLRDIGGQDTFIENASSELEKVTEKENNYGETYKKSINAKIAADKKYYSDVNGNVNTASEWLNKYSDAVDKYNDALASGDTSKISEAKTEFNQVQDSIDHLTDSSLKDYKLSFDDVGKQLDNTLISTQKLKDAIAGNGDKSLSNAVKGLKELDLSDIDFKSSLDSEPIKNFISAAQEAGIISDDSQESIDMLCAQLVNLGIVSGQPVDGITETTNAIDTLTTALTDLQTVQQNVQQALQDSMSGTGLTAEDITNVTNAYKDLESYNPYKLFEETANGVHLNRDELARLNDELTSNKLSDFNNQIEDLRNQIYEARAEGKDTSGLEEQLTNAKLLKSELEGATSAYNQLMQAMNGSNERDSYSTIGESYEKMKTTLDEGWYGDSSLNKYLDLLLSADQRTNDTQKDFEKLTKTIEGTSHSIMDYWQYDDDGNLVTDGLYDFMDDVNKKLGATFSQKNSDGLYQFDFDKEKLQEVADAFGMSTEAVELFERAMIDAGMAVDMSDFDYTGQLDKAIEKLKELQGLGQFSDKIDLDFVVDDSSIEQIRSYIDSLNGERVNIDAETNPDAAAALDELIAKCNQTYYAKINAEYDGSLDTAVGLVERLQQLTAVPISVEAKMSNTDQIHDIAVQLAALPRDVQIAVGVKAENAGDTNSIINQLNHNPSSIKVPVDYEKGKEPEGVKDAKGKANYDVGLYPKTIPDASAKVNYKLGSYPTSLPSLTQTIYQTIVGGSNGSSGGGKKLDNNSKKKKNKKSKGSKAYGTAYATGHDWALFSDEDALVNELGTESIVRDGKWFPIPGGAHVEQLKKGDIVFSAEQTRELIKTGRVISGGGHGQVALASGTAYNTLNAYESGSRGRRRSKRGKTTSASRRTTKKKSSSRRKGSSNSKSSSSNATKEAKEFEEQIDWIEIAITRATEAINRLKTVAESTFQTLTTRNNALGSEVSAISNKIGVETQAYNAYMSQANAVGLDESYASRVRNGQMDISTITDEDLSKKIKKYQDYYNNAIQARDAITELHEEIANLYKAKFDNVSKNFESQIKLIEQEKGLYSTFIDEVETSGHFASTKYYDYLISTEQKNIDALKKEYSALSDAFTAAAASGEIKEGSEAWNDMYLSVLDVQTALEDANKSLAEYQKNMRQLKWDIFDKQEEYISQIQEESDFLVDLMSNQQLYDKDTGKDTKYATASKALHAVNMNAYMSQADDYGKEVLKIDKEIANDPYNTDLIDRRNELLKSQREAIKNAEDEKQKIKELVKDGYDAQLEALQKLVDKQKENLNAQKDAYEYQQNIQEKTKNIAALQKQLQAMKGDTSEETQATIQKTQVSLQDAQKDLKDTEYQQWVNDQESLLDSVVNQVQEWQNSRLDDLDGLISQEIDSINSRAGEIADTISREAGNVGTTLSTQMSNIWNSSDGLAGVISGYCNGFQTNATSTLTTIQAIRDYVANLSKKADAEAAEKARQAEAQRQAAAAKAQQAAQAASTPSPAPAPAQPAQPSTPSWGSWFVSKRDSYPKGRLNQNYIVDRLKYRNIDSSFSARAGYYSAMGGSGRYTGSSRQNSWMVSQMKAHGYARGTKNATAGWHLVNEAGNEIGVKSGHLENFSDGDIVFNGSQTDKLWNFSRDPEAFMQNLANAKISPIIGSRTSNTQIDVGGINIEMNGVNNPQQFSQNLRDELARSPKTQNMIKSMLYEKGDNFKRFKN